MIWNNEITIMNKSDEFWYWTSKAITSPAYSQELYFYRKSNDQLFGLIVGDFEIAPLFRNSMTKVNGDRFFDNIRLYKEGAEDIFELPKLPLEKKMSFLKQFARKVQDVKLKEDLFFEANSLGDNDYFGFKTDLKNRDIEIAFQFDLERGQFIARCIEQIYFKFGISEASEVLW